MYTQLVTSVQKIVRKILILIRKCNFYVVFERSWTVMKWYMTHRPKTWLGFLKWLPSAIIWLSFCHFEILGLGFLDLGFLKWLAPYIIWLVSCLFKIISPRFISHLCVLPPSLRFLGFFLRFPKQFASSTIRLFKIISPPRLSPLCPPSIRF